MVYLISYDLNGHERPSAYARVKQMIEDESGGDCIRVMYSQWFVNTSQSLGSWKEKMKSVTDDNDRFLVVPVTSAQAVGFLNAGSWDWLKARA